MKIFEAFIEKILHTPKQTKVATKVRGFRLKTNQKAGKRGIQGRIQGIKTAKIFPREQKRLPFVPEKRKIEKRERQS